MKLRILAVFLFVLSIQAQYTPRVPCKDDESCKTALGSSHHPKCLQGTCMCLNNTGGSYGYCSNKDIMISSRNNLPARECKNDTDCLHIVDAKCYSKESGPLCDCDPGKLLSADGKRCLTIARELDWSCVESAQCSSSLGGAECLEGKCRCRSTFHYVEARKRCVHNRAFGEPCDREDENCYQISKDGKNTLGCSDDKTCKCHKNYVYVDGMCQNSAKPLTVLHVSLVMLMVMFINYIF